MAPSPVFNIEPKGPDKSGDKIKGVSSKEKSNMPMTVGGASSSSLSSEEKISGNSLSVNEIEEAGLKSLLDEAYSYRSPKDRLGCSTLFQELLHEVEANDACKEPSERGKEFGVSSAFKSNAIIENGHETVNDKNAYLNILGGCEEKKKKKKNKRDEGGSRKPKFQHSLKINHGPQSSSSSSYNGGGNGGGGGGGSGSSSNSNSNSNNSGNSNNNIGSNSGNSSNNNGGNVHFHSSSRSLSARPLSSNNRFGNSKSSGLLTSSSNLDISMVTTYNTTSKQPIMSPGLAPSPQQKLTADVAATADQQQQQSQQKNESGRAAAAAAARCEKEPEEIEMKVLDREKTGGDSVYNYTTHASLKIGGGNVTEANVKSESSTEYGDRSAVLTNDISSTAFSLQSSNSLTNGDADGTIQSTNAYRALNGVTDEKDDIENVIIHNGNDVERQQIRRIVGDKKSNYLDETYVESDGEGTLITSPSIVDDSKEPKHDENTSQVNQILPCQNDTSYAAIQWPNLIVTLAGDTSSVLSRNICAKESLESRRSYDENSNSYSPNYPFMNNTNNAINRDRNDNGSERKHKQRKPKKSDIPAILSENIEGYCGNKSISDLLEYIENNGSSPGVHSKSVRSKVTNGGGNGGSGGIPSKLSGSEKQQQRNKASTDEDIRHKKPPKVEKRLKKSTSLEDLRQRSKSKTNKKQSSVDDSHYQITTTTTNTNTPSTTAAIVAAEEIAVIAQTTTVSTSIIDDYQLAVNETQLYFDSLIDDDGYTEPEFHLVTKKHRKKKRRSKSRSLADGGGVTLQSGGNFLPQDRHHETLVGTGGGYGNGGNGGAFKRSNRAGNETRHRSRRKSVSSVVPSDKISDTDSIHSLPVSSTTPKCKIKKKSTSSGCTPQASYADIAKSPQCQSSTALNGEAKWHVKQFASKATATPGGATSGPPSHTPELVSSTNNEERVELDDDSCCDQLSLTNNDNNNSNSISNNAAGGSDMTPADVNNVVVVDDCKTKSNNGSNINNKTNINTNNNNNNNNNNCNDVTTRIDVTLKRKLGKINGVTTPKKVDSLSDTNNNAAIVSHTLCNGKIEKTLSTLAAKDDANAATKSKRTKKKNKNVDEMDATAANEVANDPVIKRMENKNEVFVEFTVKCAPVVTTKCSETQTDSQEVNNNGCCNDITVEETIVLKNNNKNSGGEQTTPKKDQLSRPLPLNENGDKITVLGGTTGTEVNVTFDVDEKLLEKVKATTKTNQLETILKEINERSSKYNVSEVIQYVNKSWNEVMKTLSSTKVASTNNNNNKVQYYSAK